MYEEVFWDQTPTNCIFFKESKKTRFRILMGFGCNGKLLCRFAKELLKLMRIKKLHSFKMFTMCFPMCFPMCFMMLVPNSTNSSLVSSFGSVKGFACDCCHR